MGKENSKERESCLLKELLLAPVIFDGSEAQVREISRVSLQSCLDPISGIVIAVAVPVLFKKIKLAPANEEEGKGQLWLYDSTCKVSFWQLTDQRRDWCSDEFKQRGIAFPSKMSVFSLDLNKSNHSEIIKQIFLIIQSAKRVEALTEEMQAHCKAWKERAARPDEMHSLVTSLLNIFKEESRGVYQSIFYERKTGTIGVSLDLLKLAIMLKLEFGVVFFAFREIFENSSEFVDNPTLFCDVLNLSGSSYWLVGPEDSLFSYTEDFKCHLQKLKITDLTQENTLTIATLVFFLLCTNPNLSRAKNSIFTIFNQDRIIDLCLKDVEFRERFNRKANKLRGDEKIVFQIIKYICAHLEHKEKFVWREDILLLILQDEERFKDFCKIPDFWPNICEKIIAEGWNDAAQRVIESSYIDKTGVDTSQFPTVPRSALAETPSDVDLLSSSEEVAESARSLVNEILSEVRKKIEMPEKSAISQILRPVGQTDAEGLYGRMIDQHAGLWERLELQKLFSAVSEYRVGKRSNFFEDFKRARMAEEGFDHTAEVRKMVEREAVAEKESDVKISLLKKMTFFMHSDLKEAQQHPEQVLMDSWDDIFRQEWSGLMLGFQRPIIVVDDVIDPTTGKVRKIIKLNCWDYEKRVASIISQDVDSIITIAGQLSRPVIVHVIAKRNCEAENNSIREIIGGIRDYNASLSGDKTPIVAWFVWEDDVLDMLHHPVCRSLWCSLQVMQQRRDLESANKIANWKKKNAETNNILLIYEEVEGGREWKICYQNREEQRVPPDSSLDELLAEKIKIFKYAVELRKIPPVLWSVLSEETPAKRKKLSKERISLDRQVLIEGLKQQGFPLRDCVFSLVPSDQGLPTVEDMRRIREAVLTRLEKEIQFPAVELSRDRDVLIAAMKFLSLHPHLMPPREALYCCLNRGITTILEKWLQDLGEQLFIRFKYGINISQLFLELIMDGFVDNHVALVPAAASIGSAENAGSPAAATGAAGPADERAMATAVVPGETEVTAIRDYFSKVPQSTRDAIIAQILSMIDASSYRKLIVREVEASAASEIPDGLRFSCVSLMP